MAQYLEELECDNIAVYNLISVGSGSMNKGDIIVVNNSINSTNLPNGANNQVLCVDTSTSTNLAYKNISSLLNTISNTAGDTLYFNGTDTVALPPPNTTGLVLTYNTTSNAPEWTYPKSITTFDLIPNSIIIPLLDQKTFAYFVWNTAKYGINGLNLSDGFLLFHAITNGSTSVLNFDFLVGDVANNLMSSYTIDTTGPHVIPITIPTPTNSAVFALKVQLTIAGIIIPNLYGFQLHFNNNKFLF